MGVMSNPEVKSHMKGLVAGTVARNTAELLKVCKKLKPSDFKKLMGVSDAIAKKDYERYQSWDKLPFKAACLAMDGPAYRGFDGGSLSPAERKIAQSKVRILSGLYGALKPYDAIRPYRMEMGSKLKTSRGANLYEFWGNWITAQVTGPAVTKGAKPYARVIVNAASNEYWKSVGPMMGREWAVLKVEFPGPTVYAKKARGLICRYAVQKNCTKAKDLKGFTGQPGDSYAFDAKASTDSKYVFRRVADKAGAKRPAPAAAGGGASKKRKN